MFLSQTSDEKLLRIKNEQVQSYPFPGNNAWQFIEDLAGNLWFTVYNQGVFRIDASAVAAATPLPDAIQQVTTVARISSNTSGQLCLDRECKNVRFVADACAIWKSLEDQRGVPDANRLPIIFPVTFSESNGMPGGGTLPANIRSTAE